MYPSEIKPEVLIEDPVRWDQSAFNYERTVSKVRGTQQRADKKCSAPDGKNSPAPGHFPFSSTQITKITKTTLSLQR